MQQLTLPFIAWLVATVLALGVTVWSGVTRRRTSHYVAIACMFGTLAMAIYHAERIGRELVFEGWAGTLHAIHFGAVVITFGLVPPLFITGFRVARGTGENAGARRRTHGKLAYAFVVAVVVTCSLGAAMTVLATPR